MLWEPRATIRGTKANKNPILQLLRAAAGQKTQRILGLNSKAFDIFPGPLPDEQNAAVNNNLGKVSNEAPTNQMQTSVDQQIMQKFRRPFQRRNPLSVSRQMSAERMMSMYRQASPQQQQQQQPVQELSPAVLQQREYAEPQAQQFALSQQQREYALQQQREYAPLQQTEYSPYQQREYAPLQQREYAPLQQQRRYALQQEQPMIPQQEMLMQGQEDQTFMPQQFSSFSSFPSVRRHSFATPPSAFGQFREQQQQQEMFQSPHQMQGEEVLPQQQEKQQMFMRPSLGYPMEQQMQEMYKPQEMQEMPAQTRGIRQQFTTMPSESNFYQHQQERFVQPSQRSFGAGDSSLRELQKAVSLPEMKYNEQSGILADPTLERSNAAEMIAQKAVSMNPLEESQNIAGGSISSLSQEEMPTASMLSNKVFQLPGESSVPVFEGERRYLPEMPWLSNEGSNRRMFASGFPSFARSPSFPMVNSRFFSRPTMSSFGSQRNLVAPHIPRRPARIGEDNDDFDEKPEVHVHIQTEKSHISKPSETMNSSLATKKS